MIIKGGSTPSAFHSVQLILCTKEFPFARRARYVISLLFLVDRRRCGTEETCLIIFGADLCDFRTDPTKHEFNMMKPILGTQRCLQTTTSAILLYACISLYIIVHWYGGLGRHCFFDPKANFRYTTIIQNHNKMHAHAFPLCFFKPVFTRKPILDTQRWLKSLKLWWKIIFVGLPAFVWSVFNRFAMLPCYVSNVLVWLVDTAGPRKTILIIIVRIL